MPAMLDFYGMPSYTTRRLKELLEWFGKLPDHYYQGQTRRGQQKRIGGLSSHPVPNRTRFMRKLLLEIVWLLDQHLDAQLDEMMGEEWAARTHGITRDDEMAWLEAHGEDDVRDAILVRSYQDERAEDEEKVYLSGVEWSCATTEEEALWEERHGVDCAP